MDSGLILIMLSISALALQVCVAALDSRD